jgi:multicomponent Na+:H+ antiporter subunit D
MTAAAIMMLTALLAPLAQVLAAAAINKPAGLRDVLVILLALIQLIASIWLLSLFGQGQTVRLALASPLPGVELAFVADPLGLVFGALVSGLGALNALYAIGYSRAARWEAPGRMQALIAFAIAATMGVAYAANLLTFFICSEALTLGVFLLIAQSGAERAQRAALLSLSVLVFASFALLLPAVAWTSAIAQGQEFRLGGLLAGKVDPLTANGLLALFVLGLAKSAVMPFHALATSAATAPAPVAASLTAVCAISVGGFSVVRIAVSVFGPALASAQLAAFALSILASASAILSAFVAISRADLRERIAYLAVSQSSLVVLAVCLASPAGLGGSSSGWFAAIMQIGANALALMTLTLSAGAIGLASGRALAADMDGMGRAMPVVFIAFACGAVSLIGAPPLAGAWSKLWLFAAAAEADRHWAMGVLAVVTVLAFAALSPVAARAMSGPAPDQPFSRTDATPLLSLITVVLAAASTASLVVLVDPLARFLAPLWEAQP